ncbi:efflux RND transporter periplasmic adaptor subunit [Breoghania sp. L-A4]|nr:efflux RND transporter periplasmic adaptor subunit [Breoghania sp. L-A4]AXS42546.1 efflux RND transporter periplasmic adaptor subunit [Breoghania sp. L-A4]
MKIRFSYLLALWMTAAVAGWMATGDIIVGGRAEAEGGVEPPAVRNEASEKPFRVRVVTFDAQTRRAALEIRGRTEADAKVEVRTETSGKVAERHVTEGSRVEAGDLLCRIDAGAREAKVLESRARLAQAKLDFEAATQLSSKGFTAETRVAALKAALDAATAGLREAEIELERTEVRAPIAGAVESKMAEVGSMLAAGQICATLINADPLLTIGQVSEDDISKLVTGLEARVSLVTGETVTGTIRYISPSADPETRTFRVEIEIDNPDGALRDGVTAFATVALDAVHAHFISPGIMTLNDAGEIGVRAVDADGKVTFYPTPILGAERDGVWVRGLPERVRIITVGQDYVRDGQTVEAAEAKAGEAQS